MILRDGKYNTTTRIVRYNGFPVELKTLATGGVVSYTGNYAVHTFTTSGTFETFIPLDVSVLLVGQGGVGGSGTKCSNTSCGGAGGASGIAIQTSKTLNRNSYEVVIGTYPGGSCTFAGSVATGGGNGENAGCGTNGFCSSRRGGSNALYGGRYSSTQTGPPGAGAGNIDGGGIVSNITGSNITYGIGGDGGYYGTAGGNGSAGLVIIRYRYK